MRPTRRRRRARRLHGRRVPAGAEGRSRRPPVAPRASAAVHRGAACRRGRRSTATPRGRGAEAVRGGGSAGDWKGVRVVQRRPLRALQELQRVPTVLLREGRCGRGVPDVHRLQRERARPVPAVLRP
ncbi:Glutaredoxin [Musa troglodytarum]|uniref:Glutaredoxin n=1 Tax=Musa troglodytarum TaxID=320322 RepID=A0A9E7KEV0_9LILI|nr:Glutaredoxin [Musa troglodytarum]